MTILLMKIEIDRDTETTNVPFLLSSTPPPPPPLQTFLCTFILLLFVEMIGFVKFGLGSCGVALFMRCAEEEEEGGGGGRAPTGIIILAILDDNKVGVSRSRSLEPEIYPIFDLDDDDCVEFV